MRTVFCSFILFVLSFQMCYGQDSEDSLRKIHVAVQGFYLFPAKVKIINSDGVTLTNDEILVGKPFGIAMYANAILTNGNTNFSVKIRWRKWDFDNSEVQFIRIRKFLCFYFVRTDPKSQRPWVSNPW